MITLSTPTFDSNGRVEFDESPRSDMDTENRRANKSQLLDGGVDISDRGHTHGDRDFSIIVDNPSRELVEQINYLLRNYPELVLANYEGLFLGCLSNKSYRSGKLQLRFMVLKKLTED